MKRLRLDLITKRWVILTEENNSFSEIPNQQAQTDPTDCPFCLNNESMTPPETDADRPGDGRPNSPGWLTRTVPNKFPALDNKVESRKEKEGIFEKQKGFGFHEVIVETPDHDRMMADLSQEEISRVIKAYRRRFISLAKDKRFKYILIFKNHGLAAGASLEHTHTQLICLPIIPKRVTEELDCAKAYFNRNNQCMFCKIVEKERDEKIRVVSENEDFIAFCPFFSRSPFEIVILPVKHRPDFNKIKPGEIKNLSAILKNLMAKLSKVLGDYPFNFLIHTSPINRQNRTSSLDNFYHWHIEFLPKLGEIAGFEWATGSYINPLLPEEAARRLNAA
jgi:UDPglucose--hexose-1-phosphate uridylyltransferase